MSADRKRKLDIEEPAGAAVRPRLDGGINPYTGRAYSQRYYDILDKRKGGLEAN
jgi:hypothetical protein